MVDPVANVLRKQTALESSRLYRDGCRTLAEAAQLERLFREVDEAAVLYHEWLAEKLRGGRQARVWGRRPNAAPSRIRDWWRAAVMAAPEDSH